MAPVSREQAFALARALIAESPAAETEVTVDAVAERFVRFAAPGPTQDGDRERVDVAVRVRVARDGGFAEARAETGLDRAGGAARDARARDRARAERAGRARPRAAGRAGDRRGLRAPQRRRARTTSPPRRAGSRRRSSARATRASSPPAWRRRSCSRARSSTRAAARSPASWGAPVSRSRSRVRDSSGFAEAIGPDAAPRRRRRVERAVRKARASAGPRALAPGDYEVVLEPPARARCCSSSRTRASARATCSSRSLPVRPRRHAGLLAFALDRRRRLLRAEPRPAVRRRGHAAAAPGAGREGARARAGDRPRDRALSGGASTGHAQPQPSIHGPLPQNLVVAAGEASAEQLVAGVRRGLLVSQMHYVNAIDARELVLTGVTRHGTWLVEDGRIVAPVGNLRFSDSLLQALARVRAVGRERELAARCSRARSSRPRCTWKSFASLPRPIPGACRGMLALAEEAVRAAQLAGATYADARGERARFEELCVKNGRLAGAVEREEAGVGVRVLADGAWGFAAAACGGPSDAAELARRAVRAARSLAGLRREPVRLADVAPARGEYATPVRVDPFAMRAAEKLDFLREAERALDGRPEVVLREAQCSSKRRELWFASSAGASVHQVLVRCGAGVAATGRRRRRGRAPQLPASFDGQSQAGGFECALELGLAEAGPRVRDEAIALCAAEPCPAGVRDLILSGNLLMLQIHESVGHASELDRALGFESDLAGHTFLTPADAGALRFGSEHVDLVADLTSPGGLATRGFDDEGSPARSWPIVRRGVFAGWQADREHGPSAAGAAVGAASRAQSWYHPPIVRMANLSLMPGAWTLDDLVADTQDGVLCDTVKMWSIDQRRWNFQFTAELGWEIKDGVRTRMLRVPTWQGRTLDFWRSCDAVCDAAHWRLWGVTNCGKGNPVQEAEMSHGAAPARFRGATFVR
jgi:TldD protein